MTACEVEIIKYRKLAQKRKTYYQLVLDRTPFYAEMGGQVVETGYLESDNVRIPIETVKKENNLSVHLVSQLPEESA